MNTENQNLDRQIKLTDIAKEVDAAQKLVRAMGIEGGDAILKINEMVFDLIGIDCMSMLNMTKQDARKHDIIRGEDVFDLFFGECCQFVKEDVPTVFTSSKAIYSAYKKWCEKTGRLPIIKTIFRKFLLTEYVEKQVGQSRKRKRGINKLSTRKN
jgi:hypothetical protein